MEGNRINLLGNQHGESVVSQLFFHSPYTPLSIYSSPGKYDFNISILDLFLVVNEMLRAQELSKSLAENRVRENLGCLLLTMPFCTMSSGIKLSQIKAGNCSGTYLPRGLGISMWDGGGEETGTRASCCEPTPCYCTVQAMSPHCLVNTWNIYL